MITHTFSGSYFYYRDDLSIVFEVPHAQVKLISIAPPVSGHDWCVAVPFELELSHPNRQISDPRSAIRACTSNKDDARIQRSSIPVGLGLRSHLIAICRHME